MKTILLRIQVPEGGEEIIRELIEANDLQAEIVEVPNDVDFNEFLFKSGYAWESDVKLGWLGAINKILNQ